MGVVIKVTGLKRFCLQSMCFGAPSFGYCSWHTGFSPVGEKIPVRLMLSQWRD